MTATTAVLEVASSPVGVAVGAQFAGEIISGIAGDLTSAAVNESASTLRAKTAGGGDGMVMDDISSQLPPSNPILR